MPYFKEKFISCSAAEWKAMEDILCDVDNQHTVAARIEDAFASGIPRNGTAPVVTTSIKITHHGRTLKRAEPPTFLDAALSMRNATAARHLIAMDHTLMSHPKRLLAHCLWSENLTYQVLALGFSFQQTLHDVPTFFEDYLFKVAPAVFPVMQQHGFDINLPVPGEQKGKRIPALLRVASDMRSDLVAGLIRAGADIRSCDHKGNTLLHIAVSEDMTEGFEGVDNPQRVQRLQSIIDLWLGAGMSIDMRNVAEQTPLHLAARFGYVNKAALLIEAGASLDARTRSRKTPLMIARSGKHTAVEQHISAVLAQRAMLKIARAGHNVPAL